METTTCLKYMPQAKGLCGRRLNHAGVCRSELAVKTGKAAQRVGALLNGDGLAALERYAAYGMELPGDTLAAKIRARLAK